MTRDKLTPVWSIQEARAFDAEAVHRGIPSMSLMERAAQSAFDFLKAHVLPKFSANARIGIVGGTGQNGGDAWALARVLNEAGHKPICFLIGKAERVKGDAKIQLEELEHESGAPQEISDVGQLTSLFDALNRCELLIDGLFGTGLSAPPRSEVQRDFLQRVHQLRKPTLALDMPSGIHADTGAVLGAAWPATWTVTFGASKRGLTQEPGRSHAGEVHVGALGEPVDAGDAFAIDRTFAEHLFRRRSGNTHKANVGRVLILAGSKGKTGAARLTALAALRSGAGLVTIAARPDAFDALAANAMESMLLPLSANADEAFEQVNDFAKNVDALAMGPGLGQDEYAKTLVLRSLAEIDLPMVLDADALNIAPAFHPPPIDSRVRVFTPHPGEAARLLGWTNDPNATQKVQANRFVAAQTIADAYRATVVLKGVGSIVATPTKKPTEPYEPQFAVLDKNQSLLSTGGTGDVLTGIVAAHLAQKRLPAAGAASLSVYAHERAAALYAKRFAHAPDRGMLASELADALPEVWGELAAASAADSDG